MRILWYWSWMEWTCDHSGFKIYLMNCNYVMKKPSKVILKGREEDLLQTAKLMSLSSSPLLWPCQQKSGDVVSFFMKHLKATSGQKGTSNSHGQFFKLKVSADASPTYLNCPSILNKLNRSKSQWNKLLIIELSLCTWP